MGSSLAWLFAFVLTVIAATVGSTKRITEGEEALVERLGRYHRKLTAGLNFGIIPFVDEVVVVAPTKEQILDIPPSEATTEDNVRVEVDAVVFWRILELEKAHYMIEDVENGIRNLVVTTLRSEIGQMTLQQTNSGRDRIIRALLEELDEATAPWGVKVTRVEIQDIKPSPEVIRALENERTAESKRAAAIREAEGRRQAAIEEAEGAKQAAIRNAEAIADSIRRIADALPKGADSQQILRYLITQRYVDANLQLGESSNSKVVFMDPRAMNDAMAELIGQDFWSNSPNQLPPGNGNSGASGGSGSSS